MICKRRSNFVGGRRDDWVKIHMWMDDMARMNDREVDRHVDVALGVMGLRIIIEPDEPVENVWQLTHGACLTHRGFMRFCPVEWCRFHVCCGMRGDAVEKLTDDSDTCVLRMACGSPHTLEEVGQAFGVTRERIRQIEQSALSKVGVGLVRIGVVSQSKIDAEKLARIRNSSRRGRAMVVTKNGEDDV